MKIKAIETTYKGYKFRSRLEARWAVFFDALGIKWEYEPEGYKLSDGRWYLPDFYLPHFNGGIYVEVKPNEDYDSKAKHFACDSENNVLMAVGCPDYRIYTMFTHYSIGNDKFFDPVDVIFESKYITGSHKEEHRLFVMPGYDPTEDWDTELNHAITMAKQAKFELRNIHG